MVTTSIQRFYSQTPVILAGALATCLLLATTSVAQVSSDACSAAAANRYPVNATCMPLAFNKPGTYGYNYNPGGCGASNQDDAFGNFIATSTLTTVQYTPTGGTDAILHVLSTCTGPSLGCSDVGLANGTETVTITTVPGTTYYVRVQRYNSNAAMNGNLCIFNPTCLYRLYLYDSFGDGWDDFFGTAYVEIIVGGVSLGLWTIGGGASGYVDFGVIDGQTVQVIYSDGGALYYDENSIELQVAGQCLYESYMPPNIGLPYTVTADCTPSTSAQLQDCLGGTTVCGNANIVSTSNHTGCSLDLSAATQGCLLNNERQGSWYYFSPSAGGSIGFTITPANGTDDYDFALWGPYTGAQCPSNAPIRCSYYDGAFYNNTVTGLGNSATDPSEGAYTPPATNNGWVQPINVTAGQVYILYIDNWSASGQNFTLSWQLSGGASLDCTVLPVELLSLEAQPRNRMIDVVWSTASENNSDRFVVERSTDNEHFDDLGSLPAAGHAEFRTDYLLTDPDPQDGANYYRLRQVDLDGTIKHSQTVVGFLDREQSPVHLFPNPAQDKLNVIFNSAMEGTAVVTLTDASGRPVLRHGTTAHRGQCNTAIQLDQVSNGLYAVDITLPDGSAIRGHRFLKR